MNRHGSTREEVYERREKALKLYHKLSDPMKEGSMNKFQAKREVCKEFGIHPNLLNVYLKRKEI